MANVPKRGIAGNTRSSSGMKKPVEKPAIGGGTSDVHRIAESATEKSAGPSVEKSAVGGGTNPVRRVAAGAKRNSAGPSKPKRQTENSWKLPNNNSSDDEGTNPLIQTIGKPLNRRRQKGEGIPNKRNSLSLGTRTKEIRMR